MAEKKYFKIWEKCETLQEFLDKAIIFEPNIKKRSLERVWYKYNQKYLNRKSNKRGRKNPEVEARKKYLISLMGNKIKEKIILEDNNFPVVYSKDEKEEPDLLKMLYLQDMKKLNIKITRDVLKRYGFYKSEINWLEENGYLKQNLKNQNI